MKKKWLAAIAMVILAAMLCGCGMILVEDTETVQIGEAVRTED